MKKLMLLIAAGALFASCNTQRIAMLPENAPSLNVVVADIQRQYAAALEELGKTGQKVKITNAEITLKVTKTIDAGAEFKVLIFTVKGGRKQEKSTAVTYVLSEETDPLAGGAPRDKKDTLKDAIVAAAKQFDSLEGTIGTLTKDSFELDIVFSVEKSGSAGLSFEIYGITAESIPSASRTVEHEMVLTFKPIKK